MLRLVFIGQAGPFAPPALRWLLQEEVGAHVQGSELPWRLVGVVQGHREPIGIRKHRLHKAKTRFYPSRIATEPSLVAMARQNGIDCLQTCDINARKALSTIARWSPDLLVCVGFDRLFRRGLLSLAQGGCINAHPSPLPKFRGPAPLFWMVRQGLEQSALTLHHLDPREDHGPIYAQEPFGLTPGATAQELFTAAGTLAGQMLLRLLPQVARGEARPWPQDESLASRAPRPRPEDVYFEASDWCGEDLWRFINVAVFFKTPWTRLGDEPFFVRRVLRFEPAKGLPGGVHYLQQGSTLLVACQDGVMHLEVQV